MISRTDFTAAIGQIARTEPVYRTGGTGADGTCDCIGLVMGAMYLNGREAYDMHSSNYFARFQTDGLQPLTDAALLKSGDIVYKAREGSLHERYLPGGRYHTGDPLDYYHAGAVVSTAPLKILHCTSSCSVNGIAEDVSAEKWTHFGSVKGVCQEGHSAVVRAPEGGTVNLRARPDRKSSVIVRVPVGSEVRVHEAADGWSKITADGQTGYMMTEFLKEEQPEADCVSVPLSVLRQAVDMLEKWI